MVDGYYLNNELTDFNIVPDKDGCLDRQPRRGRQAAAQLDGPTIVYGPDGKVRLAVGAAGGATITAQVAQGDHRRDRLAHERAAGDRAAGDLCARRYGLRREGHASSRR